MFAPFRNPAKEPDDMNPRNLLEHPIWRAEELGQPIPDSSHAVSVALPGWDDVVGYEERRPAVMDRLASGYPRFVIHPSVKTLARRLDDGSPCLPFPSARVAACCADFLQRYGGHAARVVTWDGVHGVASSHAGETDLKAFWQHTGMIVSSRQADAVLAGRGAGKDDPAVRASLRGILAGYYDCAPEDVFLTPSGMAAQFAALEVVRSRRTGSPTVQIGFPYVDTLKLQQKLGDGGILLKDLPAAQGDLKRVLHSQAVAACFCEIPGNPLLGSVDLREIAPLLRESHVPLIIDDVVATPLNVDVSASADLVATSLTKYMAGTGDAMGGALICNPRSPLYRELKPRAMAQHEELLWGEDASILEAQARTFPERMRAHNRNGLLIANRLRQHPAVERVWYPKWECVEAYEAVRRAEGGWGSLVTFLPKQAETRAARVYDALAVCKGPSLGTVFTLACPFTLLAHYGELEWAESCGVSRYLIRISVGLEDPEDIWRRLAAALAA
jgi:cystathionine gamma-synthase